VLVVQKSLAPDNWGLRLAGGAEAEVHVVQIAIVSISRGLRSSLLNKHTVGIWPLPGPTMTQSPSKSQSLAGY
jgi:hypothetical protein